MNRKRILRTIATALLLCLLAGCGQSVPEPVEETPIQTVVELPEVDDRTWAQRRLHAYADFMGYSYTVYPDSLRALLEKNREAISFVLQYPENHNKTYAIDLSEYKNSKSVPLFLQWDQRWGYKIYGNDVAGITACGPLCLSMVAFYLTGNENMSPDKIMQFAMDNGYCVPGNGSRWTLISQGAQKLGLNVQELPLVERRVRNEVLAGNPVICIMGPGIFTTSGHFIVITGYENGMYRINDPNSVIRSNQLWSFNQIQDQIRNLWALSAP